MALKNLKRNLIIATVLVFVAAAVYLNWSYNNKVSGAPDSALVAAEDNMSAQQGSVTSPAGGTDLSVSGASPDGAAAGGTANDGGAATENAAGSDYFAMARLTRQQSRDQSLSLLQTAAASTTATQEVIDDAMNKISAMATETMEEAQVENLLLAKDFSDCVVFMTDTNVTVAVPAPPEGLSTAAVARITDTITSETSYTATQIKIIEVKG